MRSFHHLVVLLAAAGIIGGAQVARSAQAPAAQAPVAQMPADAPSAPAGDSAPSAPVASEVEAAALTGLRNDLLSSIREPGWREVRYGVMVVSLDRGDTLFALNPDLPLAPASNMKLFSTAAAYYYLGPNFRYSTYALADGELQNGAIEGDLILFGTGDPAISGRLASGSVAVLRALADSLLASGVREVRGDVVGDGSYFDSEWLGRGWNPENFMAWYSAPIGALSFAENVVSVQVRPGGGPGQPARITTAPQTQGLAVANQVRTVASGGTVVRFEHGEQGLVISGQIGRAHPGVAHSVPVVDPTNYAAAALRSVLQEKGIQVHGAVRAIHDARESRVSLLGGNAAAGQRPHPRVLAVHLSPPLSEIAKLTNHISHNLYAEALLKTAGRVALGEGSFDAGARAVRYLLECEGGAVDTTAMQIVDGSGLSPLNRVTARSLIQLLDLMTRSEHWESYNASLPEAGRPRPEGLQRMSGTPAERNLRAKTGTIQNVSSLSGYVRSADGERLAFAIMANDVPSTWRAKRTEDAIGASLASFSRTAAPPPIPARAGAAPRHPTARQPAARATGARSYRVRQGDTLDGIARRHGISLQALQQANPGVDPRRIRPGQTLRIPNG
ncbi:MAG: D-alanyl-D-alanine carboxypeptidase/D-alanyl-D-alanine-endopeptidase [Gemmatimonadetes bacterium]|nr:D-alanyl-D-alanine carboxypeptidase/D-alanyl-D-alanine-endopeptidase [Gemmatimonadota bacterium]